MERIFNGNPEVFMISIELMMLTWVLLVNFSPSINLYILDEGDNISHTPMPYWVSLPKIFS